ncbi:hypothetical protein PHEL49_0990 [Polaribacter sp. Hel1_33_49]|nr:hypothetical protein PHEL49_0990 [Polaribacter sp. Hel1_33_49]
MFKKNLLYFPLFFSLVSYSQTERTISGIVKNKANNTELIRLYNKNT